MTLKTCITCQQELPASKEFFHKNKNAPDGLHSICKLCTRTSKQGHYGRSGEELSERENKRNSKAALAVEFTPSLAVDIKTGEIAGRPGWLERLGERKPMEKGD